MQIIPHFFSSFSLFHSPLGLLELTEVDDLVAVIVLKIKSVSTRI
jgi:hypothetical protein